MLKLSKLEKLRIEAYADKDRAAPAAKKMDMMFNPTSYTRTATVEYAGRKRPPMGGKAGEMTYAGTPPEDIAFQFVFDGTGVAFMGAEQIGRELLGKSVRKDIEEFKDLCFRMNGTIHQPNFLKVIWGSHLEFPCRLTSLSVKYELFDEAGDPLHAKLDCTFTEDDPAAAQSENKASPDMTHIRVVKSGDTLPLLCRDIYGSSAYYLLVAARNGLDDFRNLVPGQTLRFPPLT